MLKIGMPEHNNRRTAEVLFFGFSYLIIFGVTLALISAILFEGPGNQDSGTQRFPFLADPAFPDQSDQLYRAHDR